MELADEDLKTAIVHILKDVKENINIMERNIYLSQIKLLRMSKKKKNTLDGINSRLKITEDQ